MDFSPIQRYEFVCKTQVYCAPIPIRRDRGVDLCCYRAEEMAAYVNAGPAGGEHAALAEKQILDARGGVLPLNWGIVQHHKRNLELVERREREAKAALLAQAQREREERAAADPTKMANLRAQNPSPSATRARSRQRPRWPERRPTYKLQMRVVHTHDTILLVVRYWS